MTTEASTPTQHLPEGTNVEALHQRINQWFLDQARDLPWRRDECTPWGVMVSEFMLQQTPRQARAARVGGVDAPLARPR